MSSEEYKQALDEVIEVVEWLRCTEDLEEKKAYIARLRDRVTRLQQLAEAECGKRFISKYELEPW
jgi:hypothetical protein